MRVTISRTIPSATGNSRACLSRGSVCSSRRPDGGVRGCLHLTPREAADTPAGRERLSVLLDQFEWDTRAGHEIPVQRLRAALGLGTLRPSR